jgi:hypothetical protein
LTFVIEDKLVLLLIFLNTSFIDNVIVVVIEQYSQYVYLEHTDIITSTFSYIKINCHTAIENLSDPIGYLLDFTNPYYTALAGNMKARAKKDNSF